MALERSVADPVGVTGQPPDPVAVVAGRAAARLARQVDIALASVDLSTPQYRLMMLLDEGSSIPSAIADRLAVSPPSVTALVDGLVGRDLVERRPHPADRRRVVHVLTADGKRALDEADEVVARRLAGIAGCAPGKRDVLGALAGWRPALDGYRDRIAREAAK